MTLRPEVNVSELGILSGLDATAIAEHIKKGDFTVQEAVNCVKERVERANPQLNALVCTDFAQYVNKYNQSGFFAGVPTFIKDVSFLKGMPTRFGTRGLPETPSKKSEPFVKQFMSAGFVPLGKSTTSEFGFLPSTETIQQGETQNPIKPGYSAGGSSGGAGALVASGIVPLAHANDGGGSIRIPASINGLIGLKCSRGRVVGSPTEMLPVDLVSNGVLTRTVRDTANFFFAMEQKFKQKKLSPIGLVSSPNKKRLKICAFTQTPAGIESHPDVVRTIEQTAEKCRELGHEVKMIPQPFDERIIFDFLAYYCFLGFNMLTFGKFILHRKFTNRYAEPFSRGLRKHFIKFFPLFPGALRRLRKSVIAEHHALLSEYDLILNPVLMSPVPKLGYFGSANEFISLVMRLNNYVPFTPHQNASGAPAISLPMGICSKGLPIGAHFSAGLGEEKKLLELAFELEAADSFIMP